MFIKCTDKYQNKTLEVLGWSFVFTGVGEVLGKFIVFSEHEDAYEVNKIYEISLKDQGFYETFTNIKSQG